MDGAPDVWAQGRLRSLALERSLLGDVALCFETAGSTVAARLGACGLAFHLLKHRLQLLLFGA